MNQPQRKNESKDVQESTSTTGIIKKKIRYKPKVQFDKGSGGDPLQKFCELRKVMKGMDNPVWKTHNTSECRSKAYYKKRIEQTKRPTLVLVV